MTFHKDFHQEKKWHVTFEIFGANWEEIVEQFDRLTESDIWDKEEVTEE
jgi:hypothetical protein